MFQVSSTVPFIDQLQREVKKPLHVKINNNRQTLLSVKWEPLATKVSMHKMFLNAPKNVMDALACYIKKEQTALPIEIKTFIESSFSKFDYSHLLDKEKLIHHGSTYNLKAMYDKLNSMYFKDNLQLHITWFGNRLVKNRARCTLGLYYDSLKLIKIHRRLDDPQVPLFVVEFVVFHEMTHAICPAYIDERGIHRSHGKEFKRLEKLFWAYNEAEAWIKKHQINFFQPRV